jgi:alanine racemase
MPETILHVDLGAIAQNYATLQATAFNSEVAGVVKADAYGLGAAAVAPTLWQAGCRTFFTAKLAEATALRLILPEAVIYVLEGLAEAEIATFVEAKLRPVLNQPVELQLWVAVARQAGRRLEAALQLETGMCRMGMAETDLAGLSPDVLAAIDPTLVLSHLGSADESASPRNAAQLVRLQELAARLPAAPLSLANSSGCFLGPAYHLDMVRPGAALYGINPTPGRPNPMRPVVRIEAPVLRVLQLDAPCAVGYGATYTAEQGARIATIGVGYADGLPRSAGNTARALIRGRSAPIVGRVSMDLTTLDVSSLAEDEVAIGTPVSLLAGGCDLDDTAGCAGTIGYELLTHLGRRFRRNYTLPGTP